MTQQPRRFHRPVEEVVDGRPAPGPRIAPAALEAALDRSTLTDGGRALARGLLRTSRPAEFPGGLGLDYGALLKTAARPDVVGAHVREAARHLVDRGVDLLFVPGLSGHPIGAMYGLAAGIPAVLLEKRPHPPGPAAASRVDRYPPGAFQIPSYTGEGDTVVGADPAAVRAILTDLVVGQLSLQDGVERPRVAVRAAGADDIVDTGTMALAVAETAPEVCAAAVRGILAGLPEVGGREVAVDVQVVAWVTPLLRGDTGAAARLAGRTGILPFAGLTITAIELDPPAVGIAGLGVVEVGTP